MRRALSLCAILTLVASCNAQGGVRVELDEWRVDADAGSTPAGTVTFAVNNTGDVAHQFLVLRTTRTHDRLRVHKGVVAIGEAGSYQVGEIPLIAPGETETVTIDLPRGRYSLICNIAAHYGSGMHASFQVTAASED